MNSKPMYNTFFYGMILACLSFSVVFLYACDKTQTKENSKAQGETKKSEQESTDSKSGGEEAAESKPEKSFNEEKATSESSAAEEKDPIAQLRNLIAKSTTPVTVGHLSKKKITHLYTATSHLQASKQASIPLSEGEYVEKIHKKLGEHVEKGELIASLANPSLAVSHAKLKLEKEEAKRRFEANKKLYQKDLISKEEFDTAQANLRRTELDLEEIAIKIQKLQIIAPFSGSISKNDLVEKAHVSNYTGMQPIAMISSRDLEGVLKVPINYLGDVQVGRAIEITGRGKAAVSEISEVAPLIDKTSGTVEARFSLTGDHGFLPGEMVNISLLKKDIDKSPWNYAIAEDAIVFEGSNTYVYVVRDSLPAEYETDLSFFKTQIENAEKGATIAMAGGGSSMKRGRRSGFRMSTGGGRGKMPPNGDMNSGKDESKEEIKLSDAQKQLIKAIKRAKKIPVVITQLSDGSYAVNKDQVATSPSSEKLLHIDDAIISIGLSSIGEGSRIAVMEEVK